MVSFSKTSFSSLGLISFFALIPVALLVPSCGGGGSSNPRPTPTATPLPLPAGSAAFDLTLTQSADSNYGNSFEQLIAAQRTANTTAGNLILRATLRTPGSSRRVTDLREMKIILPVLTSLRVGTVLNTSSVNPPLQVTVSQGNIGTSPLSNQILYTELRAWGGTGKTTGTVTVTALSANSITLKVSNLELLPKSESLSTGSLTFNGTVRAQL